MTDTLDSILASVPKFTSILEIYNIPDEQEVLLKLLQHDLFKLNKLADSIREYLLSVSNKLKVPYNQDIEWFFSGRTRITELIDDTTNIDSVIFQLLSKIESADISPDTLSKLLTKYEESSDLLFDLKKTLINLKKKIDISINYNELNNMIIKSLCDEIISCVDILERILHSKLSSPRRVLPKLDLRTITSKMKINDLTSPTASNFNFSIRSLRLPTFCESDENLYSDYLSLESRIKPLEVSLDFLPLKIDEFIYVCGDCFPKANEAIRKSCDDLVDTWKYLQVELKTLKSEFLDTRWYEIFNYLIEEIIKKCDELYEKISEVGNIENEDIGATYKLCSNSITIIGNAFSEHTITDSKLAECYNKVLLPKWQDINTLLSKSSTDNLRPKSRIEFDENGLRKLKTARRIISMKEQRSLPSPDMKALTRCFSELSLAKESSSSGLATIGEDSIVNYSSKFEFGSIDDRVYQNAAETTDLAGPGLGIDLGISVDQTKVPFSIEQKDKVRDFLGDTPDNFMELKRKNLKQSLLKLNGGVIDVEDDEETLVHATPKIPFDFDHRSSITDRSSKATLARNLYTKEEVFNHLMYNHSNKPTRLPLIREDYISMGLPVIKKKAFPGSKPSKIPGISPNHPVFQSPEKQPLAKFETPIRNHSEIQQGLKPPLFCLKRNSLLYGTNRNNGSPPARKVSQKYDPRSSISLSRLSAVSLSEMTTPNLAFHNSPKRGRQGALSPNMSLNSPQLSVKSTSPERPTSSMGSRYDEVHLLQPMKTRKAWR